MQTVDFARLPLRAGQRLLDIGCGEGRHALAASLLDGLEVLAVDLNADDLATGRDKACDFLGTSPGPHWLCASALRLPFADDSVDHIICSEVLEHLPDYRSALRELQRVLRPGGHLCVSVPRDWPEQLCWNLQPAYQTTPGGHVRIFREPVLRRAIEDRGFLLYHRHSAHALHAPFWWLKCLLWEQGEHWLTRQYHRLLVWDLLTAPRLTRWLERILNPVLGKSIVLYFRREIPA